MAELVDALGLGSSRFICEGSSPFTSIGRVVEWLMALVLKTSEGNTSVGSNPTPSARKIG